MKPWTALILLWPAAAGAASVTAEPATARGMSVVRLAMPVGAGARANVSLPGTVLGLSLKALPGLSGLSFAVQRAPAPAPAPAPAAALAAVPVLGPTIVPGTGPMGPAPSAAASPAGLVRVGPLSAMMPQPLAGPRLGAAPLVSRGRPSLAGLAKAAAATALELSRLPREAPGESAWKLGRRLWETAGGGAERQTPRVADSVSAASQAGMSAAAGDSFARGTAASPADPQAAHAAGQAETRSLGRRAQPLLPFAPGARLGLAEDLRPSGPMVALLALNVAGETLLLSEAPGGAALGAREGAGDWGWRPVQTAGARAALGSSSEASPFAALVPSRGTSPLLAGFALPQLLRSESFPGQAFAGGAEAELWSALESSLNAAPPDPHRDPLLGRAQDRSAPPPASASRRAEALPWTLLLPLALAALRYRREFLS